MQSQFLHGLSIRLPRPILKISYIRRFCDRLHWCKTNNSPNIQQQCYSVTQYDTSFHLCWSVLTQMPCHIRNMSASFQFLFSLLVTNLEDVLEEHFYRSQHYDHYRLYQHRHCYNTCDAQVQKIGRHIRQAWPPSPWQASTDIHSAWHILTHEADSAMQDNNTIKIHTSQNVHHHDRSCTHHSLHSMPFST